MEGVKSAGADEGVAPRRVHVFTPWHAEVGPMLACGRLTAAARCHDGGRLNDHFDIRRPQLGTEILEEARTVDGPIVLLCSDYIWTVDDNLELARALTSARTDVLVVHGGPSAPSYPEDAQRFHEEHGVAAAVLVRGEGEDTLVAILDALTGFDEVSVARLADVAGLSYLDVDGRFVRTPDRPRRSDLSTLPSPLLTGEFDDVPAEAWRVGVYIESNRGCPYGCTFCDWGAATMSRVRRFPIEMVAEEIEWVAERGVSILGMTDANFGMTKHDVEVVEHLVRLAETHGAPGAFHFCPAKNTVRHLTRIMELLREAGLQFTCSIGIQTTDDETLAAVHRTNISTDKMLELAKELRVRRLPLPCELMVALPGQTVASLGKDLQFAFDHELLTRVHTLRALPNSPLNAPEYRAQHQLVLDDDGFVMAASSFTEADRAVMIKLIAVHLIVHQYGVLRQFARWLQWDRGIAAMDLAQRMITVTDARPDRYPELTRLVRDLLGNLTPPASWEPLFASLVAFLADEYDIVSDAALESAVAAQIHLLPAQGRRFPDTIELDHDFVGYSRSAGWGLVGHGSTGGPARPLETYGRGSLTVVSDPLGICASTIRRGRYLRFMRDDELLAMTHQPYELLSLLTSPAGLFQMQQARPDLSSDLDQFWIDALGDLASATVAEPPEDSLAAAAVGDLIALPTRRVRVD